ncbi:hypothetical protein MJO28_015199 [Puccinia striiformis f. sp. tritici]|uniref:Uncharacterized protein n=1 Tax=Puccinia striiformis f. sp. tritici TaxID=168172 RepID=A0ACC0DTD0_9BASI|nr:hypothetical protein MJO28_015199 [Puccinia striiformis f. sp. tritici]
MPADGTILALFKKILSISQSKSKIPLGTENDKIFRHSHCIPERDKDKGMFYVVNQALDSCFCVENCEENLQSGKFGIEVVLDYLTAARMGPTWKEDELLALKLDHIYKCFEDAGGVVAEESPEILSPKESRKNGNVVKIASNASQAKSGLSKSTVCFQCISRKTCRIEINGLHFKENFELHDTQPQFVPKKDLKSTSSNPKPIASGSTLSRKKINDKILFNCPKSTKENVFDACSIITKYENSDTPQDLLFKCHCGAPAVVLSKARMQNVENHWQSKSCKLITQSVSNTQPLTTYFSLKQPLECQNTESDPSASPPEPKKKTPQVLCSGLNNKNWPRTQGKLTILQCIEGSPSPHHGAPPQHIVCQQLFNTTKKSELTKPQFQQLLRTLELKSMWVIKRHTATAGIYSSKCLA